MDSLRCVMRKRLRGENGWEPPHICLVQTLLDKTVEADWMEDPSCLSIDTLPFDLAWDVLALSVGLPGGFLIMSQVLLPALTKEHGPQCAKKLKQSKIHSLVSYPVYQDDAPLFEAVALFCIHHGILRGCSSHFENECIFHRAESERQESRGALLQMETFLRLAVKKERWNVVRCLSGLKLWPSLLLPTYETVPLPLLAMCLFYCGAIQYDTSILDTISKTYLKRDYSRRLAQLAVQGPPKWKELICSPCSHVPSYLRNIMKLPSQHLDMNALWIKLIHMESLQQKRISEQTLVQEICEHYLLSDWSTVFLVGQALKIEFTLLLRALVKAVVLSEVEEEEVISSLEIADFLFQLYPPTEEQLRLLLRDIITTMKFSDKQEQLFIYYFRRDPKNMVKRWNSSIGRKHHYPIDVVYHTFGREAMWEVLRATPREYLICSFHEEQRCGPFEQAADRADLEVLNYLLELGGPEIIGDVHILHRVCSSRNKDEEGVVACARQFISQFEDRDIEDNNCLHLACSTCNLGLLRYLMEQPQALPMVNQQNLRQETPLMVAMSHAKLIHREEAISGIVELLLPHMSVEFVSSHYDYDQCSFLHLALRFSSPETAAVARRFVDLMKPEAFLQQNLSRKVPLHLLMRDMKAILYDKMSQSAETNVHSESWIPLLAHVLERGGFDQTLVEDMEGSIPFLSACELKTPQITVQAVNIMLDHAPDGIRADVKFIEKLSPPRYLSELYEGHTSDSAPGYSELFVALLRRQFIDEAQLEELCTPEELVSVRALVQMHQSKAVARLGKRSAREAGVEHSPEHS